MLFLTNKTTTSPELGIISIIIINKITKRYTDITITTEPSEGAEFRMPELEGIYGEDEYTDRGRCVVVE